MNDLCAAAMRPLVKLLRPSVILRSLSGDSDSLRHIIICTNHRRKVVEISVGLEDHTRRKGSVVDGTMASAEHEPITGVQGQSPWSGGQGGKAP